MTGLDRFVSWVPDGWPGVVLATAILGLGAVGALAVVLLGLAVLAFPGAFAPPRGCRCCEVLAETAVDLGLAVHGCPPGLVHRLSLDDAVEGAWEAVRDCPKT